MAIGYHPDELHSYLEAGCVEAGRKTRQAPAFLVTVDTECDNAWACGQPVTTTNAAFLSRFQATCELYGLRPTYFTTYEMAMSPVFREFGRDILQRDVGEIGMHLHAWNSPPLAALTEDDDRHHPYLMEYGEPIMRDKIAYLTDLLREIFGVEMLSHRAGRWGFNTVYARLLVEHGYVADCSVTPLISWADHVGDPRQNGGPDFQQYPLLPYFVDLGDISRPGMSPLLEIPVTAMEFQPMLLRTMKQRFRQDSVVTRLVNRAFPPRCLLAPQKKNGRLLLRTIKRSLEEQRPCVQFAIHSSYLMSRGSPTFPEERDVETLYEDLHELFETAQRQFRGATVAEFRKEFSEAKPVATA